MSLYLNRARYINVGTGRFWTMDTYAGNNEDPLSLHKYLYCEDNPVNREDPSGHDDFTLASVTTASDIGVGLDAAEGGTLAAVEVSSEATVETAADVTEVETEGALETEGEVEGESEASELESGAESKQGDWVNEKIPPKAEAYEQQVMKEVGGEYRAGQAYKLNNVKFDGIDSQGNLIEAKGPGYANLFEKPFAESVEKKIVDQMTRQVVARAGKQIIWHVAEKDAIPVFQQLVIRANAKGIIQIVLTQLTAP